LTPRRGASTATSASVKRCGSRFIDGEKSRDSGPNPTHSCLISVRKDPTGTQGHVLHAETSAGEPPTCSKLKDRSQASRPPRAVCLDDRETVGRSWGEWMSSSGGSFISSGDEALEPVSCGLPRRRCSMSQVLDHVERRPLERAGSPPQVLRVLIHPCYRGSGGIHERRPRHVERRRQLADCSPSRPPTSQHRRRVGSARAGIHLRSAG